MDAVGLHMCEGLGRLRVCSTKKYFVISNPTQLLDTFQTVISTISLIYMYLALYMYLYKCMIIEGGYSPAELSLV